MIDSGRDLLNKITRRFTVGELVLALLLIMIVITAINVGAVYMTLSQFDTMDNSVDVAGEQRMLTQRMARFTNHLAAGDTSPETYDALENAANQYDSNLQTLRNGGEVHENHLDPAPEPTRDEISRQKEEWEEFQQHIEVVLESEPDEPDFESSVAYIQSHSDTLLQSSDATVKAYTQYIQTQFRLLQQLLITLLASTIVLFVIGGYLTQRYVGNILSDVTNAVKSKADGSLDTEFGESTKKLAEIHDEATRNEVVILAKITQEFEANLKMVVEQTRALANQDFDADVLNENVPGEFGDSLDKMQEKLRELIMTQRANEYRLESQRDSLKLLNQTVRHDIRNDLQLVLAYAEMLEGYGNEETERYRENIYKAAKEAVDITETARDVTDVMLQTGADREPVNLRSQLLKEIEAIRSNYTGVVIDIDGNIPDVRVSAGPLLDAVFRNLLKNAIVHNDKDVAEITVSGLEDDGTVLIEVADNGPGVPEELKKSIFSEGEKGLGSGGTGLGLYLVQTLVNRYRGEVWVEDNDPNGAIFCIRLPLAESEGENDEV